MTTPLFEDVWLVQATMFPIFSNKQHPESEIHGMAEVERMSTRSLLCFRLFPSHLILPLGTQWKEPGSIFAPSLPTFWELVRFLFSFPSQADQSQLWKRFSRPLFLFVTLLLHSLHYIHVSLVLRSPELETTFQVWLGSAE